MKSFGISAADIAAKAKKKNGHSGTAVKPDADTASGKTKGDGKCKTE
ncbi:MAG: hypothetical protein IJ366_09415 [Clostridia bacterium]|nr:hypothetical protein [Clostridia bacterium]